MCRPAVSCYSHGRSSALTFTAPGTPTCPRAVSRAVNKDASPPEIASSTDDKGRWAMIGLRTGTWTFVAEAPGFTAAQIPWPVRVGGTQPIPFVLARDLGPIPNALTKAVQQQITT